MCWNVTIGRSVRFYDNMGGERSHVGVKVRLITSGSKCGKAKKWTIVLRLPSNPKVLLSVNGQWTTFLWCLGTIKFWPIYEIILFVFIQSRCHLKIKLNKKCFWGHIGSSGCNYRTYSLRNIIFIYFFHFHNRPLTDFHNHPKFTLL